MLFSLKTANAGGGKVRIIRAGICDLEKVTPLFDAYRVFYLQNIDLAGAHIFLEARMTRKESVIFIAVNDAQKAVGFIQLYPSFSSVSLAPVWTLNDLFVVPEARGKGVATHLMNKAKDFALSQNAKGIQLETSRENNIAQNLYESLGYLKSSDTHYYFLPL